MSQAVIRNSKTTSLVVEISLDDLLERIFYARERYKNSGSKMKGKLTENGIWALYNETLPTKVQVLYLFQSDTVSLLRVADSKHLSPIMAIVKFDAKFVVGDIILIKKVKFQPSNQFENKILPLIDSDLHILVILEYTVIESRENAGILFSQPDLSLYKNIYWNSLLLVRDCLIKKDNQAKRWFDDKDSQDLCGDDCNLLLRMGNELLNKENYSKAILYFDMAKQKDYYDANIWTNSSQAYFVNCQYNNSKYDALVALKLDPFNEMAYFQAGQALNHLGEQPIAIELIEAGLFICGPCKSLNNCISILKESSIVNLKVKEDSTENEAGKTDSKDLNLASNSTPPSTLLGTDVKKKITINEEINPNTQSEPPLQIPKKLTKCKESPLKKVPNSEMKPEPTTDNINRLNKNCVKSVNTKKTSKFKETPSNEILNNDAKTEPGVDDHGEDKEKNSAISSFLVAANMLYEKQKYLNALELIDVAISKWKGDEDSIEILVIKYLGYVCKFKTTLEHIEEVKIAFLALLGSDNFPYPPALHYWLTQIYESSKNEEKASHHAHLCLHLLNKSSSSLCWPETNEVIVETSPTELKKWFDNGPWKTAPLAKCRYANCITTQNSISAKTEIYSSDIDFRGYIEVDCEEFCYICYHPCCWKVIKELNEDGVLGKKTDKDFLGLPCLTPDCSGKISVIRIYDETSQLKNEIPKDKDKKNIAPAKPKKKDKKKVPANSSKVEKGKKFKVNDAEEVKFEKEVEDNKENATSQNQVKEKVAPILNQVNFEGTNYKILHPTLDEGEVSLQLPKKSKANKKKNKKKKEKEVIEIKIDDNFDNSLIQNEYLRHLLALRFHREALDSDSSLHLQTILDPDKPFYLPHHLQENLAHLENIFRNSMVTTSSSDIDKASMATLLEFMYGWLKAEGPLFITDTSIKDYIKENFPPNALAYLAKCGGIRSFLLQSFNFALVDDVICVSEQVVKAEETAILNILQKFKMGKFLISDGDKAVKLSHLINDITSDSMSNLAAFSYSTAAAAAVATGPGSCNDLGSSIAGRSHVCSASTTPCRTVMPKNGESNSDVLLTPAAITLPASATNIPKSQTEKVALKPKSKVSEIASIDPFDTFDNNMEQFLPPASSNVDPILKKTVLNGFDSLSNSNKEVDQSLKSFQVTNQVGVPNSLALKEITASSINELSGKNEELNLLTKEKERLTLQVQHLTDRLAQMKTKSSIEIDTLKKNVDTVQEQMKAIESSMDSCKGQKDSEVKKLIEQKALIQENNKALMLKTEALQLNIEQLNAAKTHLEQKNKNISILLAKQEAELCESKEAECIYMVMKRDWIEIIEKMKKRLTAEVKKMRELLSEATGNTQPSRSSLMASISIWEDEMSKLNIHSQTVKENGQKMLDLIRTGKPLASLPLEDLPSPSFPDLTLAQMLFVRTLFSPIPKVQDQLSAAMTSGLEFIDSNPALPHLDSTCPSQFSAEEPISLGYLGTAPYKESHLPGAGIGYRDPWVDHPVTSHVPFRPVANNHQISRSSPREIRGVTTPCLPPLNPEDFNNESPAAPTASSLLAGTKYFPTHSVGAEAPPTSDPSSQIFVDALPWNFTEEKLKLVFCKYDPVGVAIHEKPRVVGQPLSKYGIITFRTRQERDHLLQSGPLNYDSHTLNIQAQNVKRPSDPMTLFSDPVMCHGQDLSLMTPSSTISSLNSYPSNHLPPTSISKPSPKSDSAFGLQRLYETSRGGAVPKTVGTPSTPTAAKPKFQDPRANNSAVAIGTLPTQDVQPTPRLGMATTRLINSSSQSSSKDNSSKPNTGAYKRLMETCKKKFGNEYQHNSIEEAVNKVREQNGNSLSGLDFDLILERIRAQLQKRKSSKPSIAPWARLTQAQDLGTTCQQSLPNLDYATSDSCIICFESLTSSATHTLPCQHVFHLTCINNWLQQKPQCPMCRQRVLNDDEFPLLMRHN